jgi:hypothetical protein
MMGMYALEARGRLFILAFAVGYLTLCLSLRARSLAY